MLNENLSFRKAKREDIEAITEIYGNIFSGEEKGLSSTGWKRGIYPTAETAENALERDDLFICKKGGKTVAAAIINKTPAEAYKKGNWRIAAKDGEYMVLHTLVVDPSAAGCGVGRAFVAFYEDYAKKSGCTSLRMDTNERNAAARGLYKKLGYEEIGNIPCSFNGLKKINLILLEKAL